MLVGTGYIAARFLKEAAPERPVVFRTSGSQQMKWALIDGLSRDYLTFKRAMGRKGAPRATATGPEKLAVELSDLVITHSPHVQRLFSYFYPSYRGKLYEEVLSSAPYIVGDLLLADVDALPFEERPVDVVLVASDWARVEKNFALAGALMRRLGDLRVHVVGDVPEKHEHAFYHGFVPEHAELHQLMRQSKVCVSTSSFDAAPGVLFEAAALGCNVVASRNCGNWRLCHSELLVEPYTADAFSAAVRRAVTKPYPQHLEDFLSDEQHQTFREILEVV